MVVEMFDPPAQKDWTWHCWQEWCVPGTASGTRRHTLLSPCTPGQCFHVSANHIQDKIIHHVFIVVGGNVGICNFSFILPPHHLSQSKRGPAHQVLMQNTFTHYNTINLNNLTLDQKFSATWLYWIEQMATPLANLFAALRARLRERQ